MKIDLHVHAKERSQCARVSEEHQIQAAIRAGLHGLAITDHNRLVPAERLAELNKKYAPFHVFTGIEIDAESEHWLVLGVDDALLERPGWRYPELRDFVRWRRGFIVLAHPFRYAPEIRADIEGYPPDGIEVQSFNTPARCEAEIRALAARHGLALLHNTDAHSQGQVGTYFNDIPGTVENDRDLVKALREMRSTPYPAALPTGQLGMRRIRLIG